MTYLPANARARTMPVVRPARSTRTPAVAGQLFSLSIDLLAIWFSFWLAYQLRYVFEIGGQVYEFNQRNFADFHGRIALFAVFCIVVFLVRGVYRLSSWTTLLDEMGLVVGSVTMAMGGLLLTAYLSQFSPSRLFFVYAWAILIGALFLVRVGRRQVREALWARDIGVRRVLIVGNGTTGRRLMQMLLATPGMGMRVSGYVDDGLGRKSLTAGTERGVIRAQHLGSLEDIPSILDRNHVDEVILALPSEGHGRTLDIASWCRSAGVPFRVVPDLLQLSLDRVQLDEISGVPILSVREASIRGTNAAIKRGYGRAWSAPAAGGARCANGDRGVDHPASNRRTHFLAPAHGGPLWCAIHPASLRAAAFGSKCGEFDLVAAKSSRRGSPVTECHSGRHELDRPTRASVRECRTLSGLAAAAAPGFARDDRTVVFQWPYRSHLRRDGAARSLLC